MCGNSGLFFLTGDKDRFRGTRLRSIEIVLLFPTTFKRWLKQWLPVLSTVSPSARAGPVLVVEVVVVLLVVKAAAAAGVAEMAAAAAAAAAEVAVEGEGSGRGRRDREEGGGERQTIDLASRQTLVAAAPSLHPTRAGILLPLAASWVGPGEEM